LRIFALLAIATILVGCSETPQNMGAAVDNDQNVLTGGPITGTTIDDLPAAVKATLRERVPHAEIASIAKTRRSGKLVYEVSFLRSDNPNLYLREDGKIIPEPVRAQK